MAIGKNNEQYTGSSKPRYWELKGGNHMANYQAPTPAESPGDILANITNEDFAIYEQDFLPVEEQLIADATDAESGNKAAEAALADTLSGYDRQRAVGERGLGRTGVAMTAGQQAKVDQLSGLGRTQAGVGSANLARRGQNAQNDATITNLVQAGQSLRGVALQGLGAASSMETQRNQAGEAMKSQAFGQTMSNIGTGAGIGFAAFGPVGAVAGAGIGLLTSLF